ncbi:MAG: dihydrodipicolinate synthase family protein [Anaerolineae bacterium]
MTQPFRGVFTIPSTPFDDTLRVDEAALRREIDFCVGCGAHGLVYPVNASAFTTLSDAERLLATRIVVEQCAGRIPVVAGAAGVTAQHAVLFASEARAMGADAVIAMTPYLNKLAAEADIVAYYRAVAEAARLPVFIQNHGVGSELSVAAMCRVIREVEYVDYVKEETFPATHKLSGLLREAGPKLKGVFGGAGGRFLLLEHPRGTAGQMPGCHVTDVVVRLWNALEAGDQAEAQRVYAALAPLFALEQQWPGGAYKQVLVLRGVIPSARSRGGGEEPDAEDQRALREIIANLEPWFTWHG